MNILGKEVRLDSNKYYIRSPEQGVFIGECLGLGFFTSHIEAGDCSSEEKPCGFSTKNEAQEYLDSWLGGEGDCVVVRGDEIE